MFPSRCFSAIFTITVITITLTGGLHKIEIRRKNFQRMIFDLSDSLFQYLNLGERQAFSMKYRDQGLESIHRKSSVATFFQFRPLSVNELCPYREI